MNVGGIFMFILVVAAAVVGTYAIFSKIDMTAPVDSHGNTTSIAENITRGNVSAIAPVVPTSGVFLTLVGAGILLAIVGIYVMGSQKNNFKSRY